MKNQFVPYLIALKARERGFNEACLGEYRQWDGSTPWLYIYERSIDDHDEFTIECPAPLYQQIFFWILKECKMLIVPHTTYDREGTWYYFSLDSIEQQRTMMISEGSFDYHIALNKFLLKYLT